MSQVTTSGTLCPKCRDKGNENFLKTQMGRFGYFCDKNHIFEDTEDLQNALAAAARTEKRKEPGQAAPVVADGAEPEPAPERKVVLSEAQIEAVEAILGQTVTGGGDLKGAIWAMANEAKGLNEEIERLRHRVSVLTDAAGNGGSGIPDGPANCRFTVQLDEFTQLEALNQWAENYGKPTDQFVQDEFQNWMNHVLGLV